MNTFSESVLRGMTNEELLREQPSELLCKILIERMDEQEEDEPEEDEQEEGGLEGLLEEIEELLENASEPLKKRAKPYRVLIEALEKLHNQYS